MHVVGKGSWKILSKFFVIHAGAFSWKALFWKELSNFRIFQPPFLTTRQRVTVFCCYLCLWWLFGHLSNDYELSAIKIRAEIYFRVKIQFRHF